MIILILSSQGCPRIHVGLGRETATYAFNYTNLISRETKRKIK